MGIFEQIKKDHGEVKDLFSKLMDTTNRAVKTRMSVSEKLKHTLDAHMEAEEQTLYPVLLDNKKMRHMGVAATEEHNIARIAGERLMELDADDEAFKPRLEIWKQLVEHHISEEENEIIPEAQDMLGQDQIDDMSERFQEAKEETMAMA